VEKPDVGLLCCVHRIDDNALRSTLHIARVEPSDFDGEYECWLQNKHATLSPAAVLTIRRRRKLTISCVVAFYKKKLNLADAVIARNARA